MEIYFISWTPFLLVAVPLVKILPMVTTQWNKFRSFTEKNQYPLFFYCHSFKYCSFSSRILTCYQDVFSNSFAVNMLGLTHYQTTNFRLFQTERVCRRQFQIWWKWQEFNHMDRKHCGKRRNCSLRAISPFPTVFSKGLFPRGVKRCHCVGMG